MKASTMYLIPLLLVLAIVMGCSSHKPARTFRPPSGMGLRHVGDVVFVSNEKIVLRYIGEEHTFLITPKTRLLVALDALKPGDLANVLTTGEDESTALEVKRGGIEIEIPIR